MSGTLNNTHNNVSFALNLHYEAMARLQEQAYTGSRINRASDDPSAAYRVLGLNSQKRSLGNYMDSLLEVISLLDISSTAIESMKLAHPPGPELRGQWERLLTAGISRLDPSSPREPHRIATRWRIEVNLPEEGLGGEA